MHHLRITHRHIAAVLATSIVLAGCDPTRRVPQGSYLLKRSKVEVDDRAMDPGELELIVKQKPNKRILLVPFYLNAYNLPDPEKIPMWQAKKDARIDRKNVKRLAKGKEPKPYKSTRADWLRNTVGEPPTILDSNLTRKSEEQMRLYMAKEGWFRAQVSDTVVLKHRRWFGPKAHQPKAVVTYRVAAGPVYSLRHITFQVDNEKLHQLVTRTWEASLLDSGARFDDDVLEAERNRITDQLRDDGFLFFNRDLIQYSADTTVEGNQVDLIMRIERPLARGKRGLAGTPEGTVYTLQDVTVTTYRPVRGGSQVQLDTMDSLGYHFQYLDRLQYKPRSLLHPIFLRPEERYRQSNSDKTYRRLTGLNVFDRVEIAYDTAGTRGPGMVNARISLLPSKKQSLTFEPLFTNRGGALGVSTSVGYRHRNLFRSLASLQASINLGVEAQQKIAGGTTSDTETSTGLGTGSLFNTVSIGPEVTLAFPLARWFSKSSGARTLVNALYNYQRRPDYTRSVAKVSLGVQWNETRSNTFGFFPLDLNSIRIPYRSPEFVDYLTESNDPVLRDSYTDHLIAGMRGTFTHVTPEGEDRVNAFYARCVADLSGYPMGIPMKLIATEAQDTSGNTFYTVAGVRYAEFIKLDVDLRWRHTIHDKSSVAFRGAAGAGIPYGNLNVLPFETSFFVGGANGLRAWRSRSIGPGSFSAPLVAYDRIGEFKLEGNAEYRFKLIGFLEGALFVDVGNIWNFKEDVNKPGGKLSREFLSELAVGTGFGARLNFEFFIVRFDLGYQTKDPSLPKGERWFFQPKDQYEAGLEESTGVNYTYRPELNFNLGIGYPF